MAQCMQTAKGLCISAEAIITNGLLDHHKIGWAQNSQLHK
jgi:hypothetical protein